MMDVRCFEFWFWVFFLLAIFCAYPDSWGQVQGSVSPCVMQMGILQENIQGRELSIITYLVFKPFPLFLRETSVAQMDTGRTYKLSHLEHG